MGCPDWEDLPQHRTAPECFAAIQQVVARACTIAQTKTPNKLAVCAWHRDAFRGIVPKDYYAGNFRQNNRLYPCLAVDVHVNYIFGTHWLEVERAMKELFSFMDTAANDIDRDRATLTPAELADRIAETVGFCIGRFIHIHPFRNGNGRTSRILWKAMLARFRLLSPNLSVIRRPTGNYGSVMAAAMVGQYGPAIAMVLNAMQAAPLPATPAAPVVAIATPSPALPVVPAPTAPPAG